MHSLHFLNTNTHVTNPNFCSSCTSLLSTDHSRHSTASTTPTTPTTPLPSILNLNLIINPLPIPLMPNPKHLITT